jgi:hypothetical protein
LEHPLRGVAALDEVLGLLELLLENGQVVGELVLDAQLDAQAVQQQVEVDVRKVERRVVFLRLERLRKPYLDWCRLFRIENEKPVLDKDFLALVNDSRLRDFVRP